MILKLEEFSHSIDAETARSALEAHSHLNDVTINSVEWNFVYELVPITEVKKMLADELASKESLHRCNEEARKFDQMVGTCTSMKDLQGIIAEVPCWVLVENY